MVLGMHGLQVERYPLADSMSRQLADDLYAHRGKGRAVVVAEKPTALLSSTRKRWAKLTRRLQRERSSTLDAVRIAEVTAQIAWMQQLKFTAKSPDGLLQADVTFAIADDLVRVPPVCSVIFVTYNFEREKLHMLTSWMPRNSRVVIYE
jgi:hypothetical protein